MYLVCVKGKCGFFPPLSFRSTTACERIMAYSIIPFINQDLRLDLFSNWFYCNILLERLLLLSGLSNEVDKLQLYNVDKLLS